MLRLHSSAILRARADADADGRGRAAVVVCLDLALAAFTNILPLLSPKYQCFLSPTPAIDGCRWVESPMFFRFTTARVESRYARDFRWSRSMLCWPNFGTLTKNRPEVDSCTTVPTEPLRPGILRSRTGFPTRGSGPTGGGPDRFHILIARAASAFPWAAA